ncbi:ATP-binding cassette domain-containing protein [Phototrophicus methaneseepsis]|uniref:ATP-binding cassette domain-containing protein n=1 Tax=Phototrophicus methaneseepsis TaxID=2710758 RepID=A0A7S8E6R2_9CHLR|nr:ATP-binding cassette domain-containing protein [Phototrophicus methaneseepsis]QPC81385.1 ATP-binding cassette domain-containing protein [Phototrophicus methaneseepsis]
MAPFVVCENLVKIYKIADLEVVALQGLDLIIEGGEMIALVGPSGSGKSTLMNILGGLDSPSAGRITVGETDIMEMKQRDQVRYRRDVVGFVWQQTARNLLPYLTALENVEMPMAFSGVGSAERRDRATELLEQVGLGDRLSHRPENLSGGEQQRVALAIAMANRPQLLLADEPTGEVDSQSANDIFDTMRTLNAAYGVTIVIVTHDHNVSRRVNRVVGMRDGRASVEVLRRAGQDGVELTAEEFAVLDRTGRLQLPHQYMDALNMRDRVIVRLLDDHIEIYPDVQPTETTAE